MSEMDEKLATSVITPELIDALLWGREFGVDLFVHNSKEVDWNFRAKNPFYIHHIFKHGKVLYEKKQ